MKIIKPWIEIRDFDGVQMMKNLELAAKQCYRSQGNITEDSYKKFLTNCLNRGHESVIEHEKISIRMCCDVGCYDKDTLVLTTKGWKYFRDVSLQDHVYTLDDNNNVIEYPIRGIIKKPYRGQLDYYHSTQINLAVTPDHNMWVFDTQRSKKNQRWTFIESQNLTKHNYKFSKQGNKLRRDSYNNFILPSVEKHKGFYTKIYPQLQINNVAFYKLLGLWITDGSVEIRENNRCYIKITQHKKNVCNIIEQLLKELNFTYSKYKNTYNISNVQFADFIYNTFYRNKNFKKQYDAYIPDFIRNAGTNEIEAFIEGVILGDGSKHRDSFVIYTASEKFAQDLVELLFKIGKTSNYYPCPNLDKYQKGFRQTTITYCVSINKTEITWFDNLYVSTKYKRANRGFINYDDYVYCLMLDKYHKLFVMRNGKTCWCGNCYKDITRHRHASFSIESTRYCNYSKDKFDNQINFIKPCNIEEGTSRYDVWKECMQKIEECYNNMAEIEGTTVDQLRMLLPHSTAAELYMTANIREWRHILSLRADKHAHPSVQQVMIPLLLFLQEKMPELFNDISYNTEFNKDDYAEIKLI